METSFTPGSIVVGVDGSQHANRAVVWAAEQADREGRRLALVHSVHGAIGADWKGLWSADRDSIDELVASAALGLVEDAVRLATAVRPRLDVRPFVVDRDPRDALIDASDRAHLVVVGSHGRSAWSRLALGSVSTATSQHSVCPVVVVGDRSDDVHHHGVLVGADGRAESLPVIEFAFRHASQRGLPLTVMHCYWDVAGEIAHGQRVGRDERGVDDLRLMLSESVAGMSEKFPDVDVELQLARGLVDVVLTGDAAPRDLIVVGRRHPSVWSRLLYGSATTAVLDRAHGNVAVVPAPQPEPVLQPER